MRSIAALCVVLATTSCAGRPNDERADRDPVSEQRAGYATTCLRDGRPVSTSYRVADMGRDGTPPLTAAEQSLLATIERYVRSSTLRVAFLGTARRMIVYDATKGPCYGNVPGYRILNDDCNGFFLPTDGFTTGLGGPCPSAPPWMPRP